MKPESSGPPTCSIHADGPNRRIWFESRLTMSETITVTLTLTKEEATGLAVLMNRVNTDTLVDAVSWWKDEGTRLLWPTEQSGNVHPIPRMYPSVPKVDEPALLDAMERAASKLREALVEHVSIDWADDD
jgi:hypothetical protein